MSESGKLTGGHDLGDLRVCEPESGWYCSAESISKRFVGKLRSSSMTELIAAPSVTDVPFNAEFQRHYRIGGIIGEELEVFESEFVLDSQNRIARPHFMGKRIEIIGNLTEFEGAISGFEWCFFTYLSLFSFGLIAINAIAILLGLLSLARLCNPLSIVREGIAQCLTGRFPAEI